MASSAKIKVVVLASEWSSRQSGLSSLNRELAIQLAKHQKVEVFVFLPKCDQTERNAAMINNVTLVQAEPKLGFDEIEWLSFPPEGLEIDFVIGCGVKLGCQARIISRRHSCKWIQIAHTFPEELNIFRMYSDPISSSEMRHQQEVELCAMADLVLAVGPKLAEAYRSYLRFRKDGRVFELTPGILNEFADIRHNLFEEGIPKVLAFGPRDAADFYLKGYDIVANAVAKLDDARLIYVGGASMEQEEVAVRLKECNLPASRMIVRNFTHDPERLKRLFCEVDLLVMPERRVDFVVPALEALSAGLPMLVISYSGFGEALQQVPFGSAFVIHSEDPENWAEGIRQSMAKPRAIRLKESKVILQNYAEKYNWQKQTREIVEQMVAIHSIPSYVDDRDEKAQAAYARALSLGETYDKRVKILIVGQDRVGKTSLGKVLRGERFDFNETSTSGVQMTPPIKNAGADAWRNPDDTHVFDYKVTAEMTRELQSTPAKQSKNLPHNETEEEKRRDQISDESKERTPRGEPLPDDALQGNREPLPDDALQGNRKNYENEQGEAVPDIMSEEVKSLYEKRQAEDQNVSEDTIWPIIWDFAGQDIYRAIHPMFMSPEAIYLLAFDLTQKLHNRAVCRVNLPLHKEKRVQQRDIEDTNLDHVMRWMDLIHALNNPNSNKKSPSVRSAGLPPSLPPVILVGTHADGVDPSKIASQSEQIKSAMEELYDHVVNFLPVDNSKAGEKEGKKKIVTLRTELLKLAEKMPHTLPLPENRIPLQWHRVEKELSKTTWQEKNYITKKTFQQEIVSKFCNFRKKDDIDGLIRFLVDRGSIVYQEPTNDQDGLVFLDPQWLINMITQIINVNPLDEEAEAFDRYREKLQTEGILHKKLLDYRFQNLKLDPVKDSFISLMQRFNLICMWPSKDPQDPLILVPCMLTSEGKDNDQEDEMTSTCCAPLCLKFEGTNYVPRTCCAPLYLKFEGTNYVPGGLFCRLVVLFGKWLSINPKEEHTYKLHSHEAQFSLEVNQFLRLVCYKRVIELCIWTVDSSPPKYCAEVLSLVTESMETLKKGCHWLLSMLYKICVRCTICMKNSTKRCQLHNKKKCLHHDCGHYIPLDSNSLGCKVGRPLPRDAIQRLQPWIDALQEKPETTRSCVGMQEEDRKALRSNREALLKDLEAKRVASLLYSRDIFSEEDKDSVNAKSTPAEQREEVLDILPRKGPEAFGVFCAVLLEVSPHLAALLRPIQEDGCKDTRKMKQLFLL